MNNQPSKPQSSSDLKKMLKQYDKILTPQNKQLIGELIAKLDNGSSKDELQDLAGRMQKAAGKVPKKK